MAVTSARVRRRARGDGDGHRQRQGDDGDGEAGGRVRPEVRGAVALPQTVTSFGVEIAKARGWEEQGA